MHTRKCLADAVICAVQNLRDSDNTLSDEQFLQWLEDGVPLQWALHYLEDGTKSCICDEEV